MWATAEAGVCFRISMQWEVWRGLWPLQEKVTLGRRHQTYGGANVLSISGRIAPVGDTMHGDVRTI